MENYIMIDGVKIPLTDDQVKMMRSAPSPFKRVDGCYFWIDSSSNVVHSTDCNHKWDVARYSCANYCTDKKLLTQRALHETLNRLLWRFSMERGEGENPWDRSRWHYFIYLDHADNEFCTLPVQRSHGEGTIHFSSEKIAKRAIEEIVKPFMKAHPDFVW